MATSKTKAKKTATKQPPKKATRKPAKKKSPTKPSKPTKKQSGKPPTDAALLAFAKAGDCDGIFRALEPLDEEERDDAAYKWLAIASDFGHAEADEYMDGMLEGSSLRYDDDQMVVGGIHFELGAAYLTGSDGLDRDVDKARAHLTMARERHYPWTVQGTKKVIADLAKSASADRALVAELFTAEPEHAGAGSDDDE